MYPDVFRALKASTGVKAFVGTNPPRVYRQGRAPAQVDRPYITWLPASVAPENNLSDLPPSDRVRIQLDCWHQTDGGVDLMATAVRDAMEPHGHMLTATPHPREPVTELYRVSMDFDWFVDR